MRISWKMVTSQNEEPTISKQRERRMQPKTKEAARLSIGLVLVVAIPLGGCGMKATFVARDPSRKVLYNYHAANKDDSSVEIWESQPNYWTRESVKCKLR